MKFGRMFFMVHIAIVIFIGMFARHIAMVIQMVISHQRMTRFVSMRARMRCPREGRGKRKNCAKKND